MSDVQDKLRTLYTRLIDSRDGYEQAMDAAERPTLNSMFSQLMDRRLRNSGEIKSYLADRGVEVEDDGSILASAHRTFLSLKSMMSDTDEAILEEVLRGEKELRDAYDAAIVPASANDPEFKFLSNQYSELGGVIDDLENKRSLAA